jgi:glutathione S-transferase
MELEKDMSEFVIYGNPASPYYRAVALALEEKGQSYRNERVQGEEHLKVQPFGRIPGLRHGDYTLYETQAILRYLDALYPTPALQPKEPQAIGRMNQLIGINDCYLFPQVARIIVFQRIVGPTLMGLKTDEAACAGAVPDAKRCLGEINRLLGNRKFLAGDQLTLADLMIAPQLYYIAMTPEGSEILKGTALTDWLGRMNERASMRATLPPEQFRKVA